MRRILVIDDDPDLRSLLCDALRLEGYATAEAGDGVEALAVFRDALPDAVLLDLQMPRRGGLATLRELRAIAPETPVVILTGYADIASAVEAVKGGAWDYIQKPPDIERILLSLRQALDNRRLEREVRRVSAALDTSLEGRFGASPAIRAMLGSMKQVAPTDLAVIVQGETGTGKTYVARAIHELSRRAANPFVRVDISVIPPSLSESELFGSRKGAYTGAEKDRIGYVASANKGTLFLDDIENVPIETQAKLLDVLETKRVCPVGGGEAVALDFRVITASNRDLKACVAARSFREDLLYRLGEFVIAIPPLRERPEDILFFMDVFLLEACTEMGRHLRGFSAEAADRLLSHPWPGNIRELKNVVRRATLLAEGEFVERDQVDFLAPGIGAAVRSNAVLPLKDAVHELERRLILDALEKTGGNKSRAAELLKISYPNLLGKVKDYALGD